MSKKTPKTLKACKHVADLDNYLEDLFAKDPRRFLGFAKNVAVTMFIESAASPDDLGLEKRKNVEEYRDPENPEYYSKFDADKECGGDELSALLEHVHTFDKP